MDASAVLQNEHDVLRQKLALLEASLLRIFVTPAAVRRLTSSLAPLFLAHIAQEEALLSQYHSSGAVSAEFAEHLASTHKHDEARLTLLNELLSGDAADLEEQAIAQGGYLIRNMREHLAAEETDVFPLFDGAPADGEQTNGKLWAPVEWFVRG